MGDYPLGGAGNCLGGRCANNLAVTGRDGEPHRKIAMAPAQAARGASARGVCLRYALIFFPTAAEMPVSWADRSHDAP
jgi:hypothetical protein